LEKIDRLVWVGNGLPLIPKTDTRWNVRNRGTPPAKFGHKQSIVAASQLA
jgi:hypothetical protein